MKYVVKKVIGSNKPKLKPVLLNDILNFQNLDNVRIRFLIEKIDINFHPAKIYEKNRDCSCNNTQDITNLCYAQYWNYEKKIFQQGQKTIGFFRIDENDPDKWLLFHMGTVTKDLNKLDDVGYECDILKDYEKYFGRLVIKYHNSAQNLVRRAEDLISKCEVIYFSTFKDYLD